MRYCLYFDPSCSRSWHRLLVERMSKKFQAEAHICRSAAAGQPSRIARLLDFENHYLFKGKPHAASPLPPEMLEAVAPAADRSAEFDLVIDLVGDGNAPRGKTTLTLLFNGFPSEKALIGSIMRGGMPQIALSDQTGTIVATGDPSSELAKGLSGAMEQTYARVMTLVLAYIDHPDRWLHPLRKVAVDWPGLKDVAKWIFKMVVTRSVKQIYYRLFLPSHWRVGWRWVTGQDVWSNLSLSGERWTVLDDLDNHFYADPVPWKKGGNHYLFFEDLDHKTQKGIISVVKMEKNGPAGPIKPCLEEPFHLSYPFLIEHEGETYMIPETSADRKITLYKSSNFPFGWKPFKTILNDIDAADATITRHEGRWWLFCVTRDGGGGYSDCLSIFYAEDLFGPWLPHAQNPVLIDRATARPAGNFVIRNGRLCRPVQDCSHSYGWRMQLVEVTELTPEKYEQQSITKLTANDLWPGRKLHTLNRAGNLEVIDGAVLRPRSRYFKPITNWLYRPASDD